MGELVAGAAKSLSPQQALLVETLMTGADIKTCAYVAAYSSETSVYRALRSPMVQAALREARAATIRDVLSLDALKAIKRCLAEDAPLGVQGPMARWVVEMAQKDELGGKDVPIHEMTAAQLDAFMARAQAVIDEGGAAPIISVTPDNGALPDDTDPVAP